METNSVSGQTVGYVECGRGHRRGAIWKTCWACHYAGHLSDAAIAAPVNISPEPAVGQRWSIRLQGADPTAPLQICDLLPDGVAYWLHGGYRSMCGAWPPSAVSRAAKEGRARYLGPT